jgi:DNA polymerase-1
LGIPQVITLDFETEAIGARPLYYPPRPVGCAVRGLDGKSFYMAWGHPTKNNIEPDVARSRLLEIWRSKTPLLFHNAKFDYEVATHWLKFPELPWERMHDTLYLIFLQNPNRSTLSLKPVAAEVLNLPPAERDAVRDWLVEHGIVRKNEKGWGAYISKAPGDIVGRYAKGDVDRTYKLFKKYYKEVVEDREMLEPYNRERELMPILLKSEQLGVHINLKQLRVDVPSYEKALEEMDGLIRKRLRNKNLNVDSNTELADAILKNKKADLTKWPTTPTGAYSTAKTALDGALNDRLLAGALAWRGTLATCLRTFLMPWLLTAEETGGIIHTSWNQVAQDYHDSGARKGTRTGRLSSTPNFQNIPTNLDERPALVAGMKLMADVTEYSALTLRHPIPMVRGYIVPTRGHVLLNRDYSQQELRILAHFEGDALMQAYEEDPWTDMHELVQREIIGVVGYDIPRKPIKVLNFGMIYGMGIGKLALGMNLPLDEAKTIKSAHTKRFPGVRTLMKDLETHAKKGQPIRTWGGREYYVEEPVYDKNTGEKIEFYYKLLNTLIQGSAADNTKQAMINYEQQRGDDSALLLNVHDELMAECPKERRVEEMRRLRDAMADVKFDVPMLSEGRWSAKNWVDMKDLPRGE